jgi:hypothetical protein
MLDWTDIETTPAEAATWQARARSALAGLEQRVAAHVTRGAQPGSMSLSLLRHNRRASTILVEADGEKAVLKAFGAEPRAWSFYDRERTALRLMRAPAIAPALLAFSDARRFTLTRFVPNLPVEAAVDRGGARAVTRSIGAFLADYEAAAPAKPAYGNWYDFLMQFQGSLELSIIEQGAKTLRAIPLCGLVLSRDDPAMSNLLMRPDGTIAACDFERAVFRPRGWDFIRTWEALFTQSPFEARAHCAALAEGFRARHRGVLLTDELAQVAGIVTAALAAGRGTRRGAAHGD